MNYQKRRVIPWLLFALALLSVLLLAWPPLFIRAEPTLPSRFTPTPTRPSGEGEQERELEEGAYIELRIQDLLFGAWTVVQWQDTAGNWHDVEGWQGWLDATGGKVWWVAARDFGTGPFRWAIYRSKAGELLAISQPFYLPNAAGEIIRVEVSFKR